MAMKPPPFAAIAASAITEDGDEIFGIGGHRSSWRASFLEIAQRAEEAASQTADHDVPVAADQPFGGEGGCDRHDPRRDVTLAAETVWWRPRRTRRRPRSRGRGARHRRDRRGRRRPRDVPLKRRARPDAGHDEAAAQELAEIAVAAPILGDVHRPVLVDRHVPDRRLQPPGQVAEGAAAARRPSRSSAGWPRTPKRPAPPAAAAAPRCRAPPSGWCRAMTVKLISVVSKAREALLRGSDAEADAEWQEARPGRTMRSAPAWKLRHVTRAERDTEASSQGRAAHPRAGAGASEPSLPLDAHQAGQFSLCRLTVQADGRRTASARPAAAQRDVVGAALADELVGEPARAVVAGRIAVADAQRPTLEARLRTRAAGGAAAPPFELAVRRWRRNSRTRCRAGPASARGRNGSVRQQPDMKE